ncbi:hypothetical protein BCR41DRAFT_423646 [Lobosporangium transversale]|uniref:CCR4-NOT transcription complex subunit 11 n=1 Tax=Lobosporangium transversale TaxID=64571 RepID=A0A1Y2GH86_9FUNG|nr:hypothetical protein BCR41DRAFT_423646 [Lobosporangium transversale]ORZ10947.1 hypothetical protein BCR41DRAFT_423646 [Lobosporangium transversale]|eukprot:XP_021879464.1 hypothetical protein BCR41DRAFT_423646 [Lobosporangium transversale]
MITVPSQELATFLGNHLDQVLQQSALEFSQTLAANRQFKAGCALMDVLNAVESVQERIRAFLQERRRTLVPTRKILWLQSLYSRFPIHQNPFLCLFMDIYTTSLQDEQQRPERFVVSVILSGDGEELAPSTPSELITIAHEVESKQINFQRLEDFFQKIYVSSLATNQIQNNDDNNNNGEDEEEELEEWEIEAEKHFQDAEDAAPAPAKVNVRVKKPVEVTVNRQQLNAIMEQAAVQPLTFDQEQTLPGIVDNNPSIAFNLLLYLIQLSSDLDGTDISGTASKLNGNTGTPGKISAKSSNFSSPEPSIVDAYLDTMTHAKRLTLHSLEVVNRLTGATTLSPRFLHAYIENAIRCCELVDDKVGQARVVLVCLLAIASTEWGYHYRRILSCFAEFLCSVCKSQEVAILFQSLVEYQRKMDAPSPSPVQTQGPSFRGSPQQQQQQQAFSRQSTQSASVPSTPTTDTPSRSSWLASSGSISNVKSTLSKHSSLNGFSTPGVLSQFIHPGPASSVNNNSIMSASVNAFNSGLGNPTSLTLNGGNSGSNGQSGFRARPGSGAPSGSTSTPNSASIDGSYDLDAALRASLRDMEARGGVSSTVSGSTSSNRTLSNGQYQQQQQQQPQTIHLGPKGLNTTSHFNQARGRGARRGG